MGLTLIVLLSEGVETSLWILSSRLNLKHSIVTTSNTSILINEKSIV